ncbi:hypothetical protein A5821_002990 [Enterococcus sp. 7F3_DIV0205]|uniref:BD-FAE-like domain-containing protein n=1 Tax=Candidatus Enterococcus palustris TaxID=1834189 RepID=A0AAQ3WE91_9ENTE|nr:prolyl oligopeptidase family serine peptidase [Enterococcus sp. 7F3_DIV0205]OTN83424.1 hypothetical protein A5821_003347 [Enterococcus sp. 7F3_DIV0205]
MKTQKISYGASRECFFDLMIPDEEQVCGPIIVLIHGGYWRTELTNATLTPLQQKLANEGFISCNVEYRRGQKYPWPIPLKDVRNAIIQIKNRFKGMAIILIGHSVGGQLSLLNADIVDKVVGLAPVIDLIYTRDKNLGDSAVTEYYGQFASDELLKQASPIHHLPLACSLSLIIHGANDQRVHIETSLNYFRDNLSKKNNIDMLVLHDMPHGEIIQPEQEHISLMIQWIKNVVLLPRTK